MELRQLRYFAKAATLLSFSEAARALNVAQSTLSQQVRALEDELRIQLFERQSHNIALTEAGSALLPFAMKTINDAETCVAKVNDISGLATGTLNIGVTYSFSPILTETLIEFSRLYPGIKLNVLYRPMAELMEHLAHHTVDFVLAFRPSRPTEEIESHVLFTNRLSLIVRDGHPLASRRSVTPDELAGFNLALPCRGLQARNAFDHCMATHGGPALRIRVELNEVNILLELVKHSNMATILAEATVYNQLGVRAIPLELPDSVMEGCIHMLRHSYRKHSALKFIDMLKDADAIRRMKILHGGQ